MLLYSLHLRTINTTTGPRTEGADAVTGCSVNEPPTAGAAADTILSSTLRRALRRNSVGV